MAVPSVEERLVAERARMRPSIGALRERVEANARGPRSREILLSTLDSESLGHLDFALFTCPPVIERGEGARLWDVDGNEYVDCHAGFTVAALGHANAEVNDAIAAQLGKVMHYAELPMAARAELSRRMAATHPGAFAKKVFYGVTGGEAVEIAVKLARWYTGKPFVLTHMGDYHGRTAGAMGLTSKAFMVAYNWPIPAADQAVIRLPFATATAVRTTVVSRVQALLRRRRRAALREQGGAPAEPKGNVTNVAAFVVEPFQQARLHHPADGLPGAAGGDRRSYDVLFVADEIQCGMGRSGRMWAIEHAGRAGLDHDREMPQQRPADLDGTGRAEIMDALGPGGHSTTFAGIPRGGRREQGARHYERDDVPGRPRRMARTSWTA